MIASRPNIQLPMHSQPAHWPGSCIGLVLQLLSTEFSAYRISSNLSSSNRNLGHSFIHFAFFLYLFFFFFFWNESFAGKYVEYFFWRIITRPCLICLQKNLLVSSLQKVLNTNYTRWKFQNRAEKKLAHQRSKYCCYPLQNFWWKSLFYFSNLLVNNKQ